MPVNIPIDAYANLGDVAAIATLTGLTVCATVRPSGTVVNDTALVSQWGSASQRAFLLNTRNTTGLGFVLTRTGDTSNFYGLQSGSGVLSTGTEARICARWRYNGGSPNLEIWVDGVSLSLSAWWSNTCSSIAYAASDVRVGDRTDGNNSLNADFSEIAIFDHYVENWFPIAYTKGYSPEFYPKGRILYWRALSQTDTLNRADMTTVSLTDTLDADDRHPTIFMPTSPRLIIPFDISGTDNLTPSDVITGAPALDSPAIGQVHVLTPSDVTTGAPSVDAPALARLTTGFNFRATPGYVTDGDAETYVLGSDTYPTTRDGRTFGWDADYSANDRDRSAGLDPRLAGVHFHPADSAGVFRVDLPEPGTYDIRLAVGDITLQTGIYIEVLDDETSLFSFGTVTMTDGNQWFDASGVLRTNETAWVDNNVSIRRTFATTTFYLINGGSGSGENSAIAHLEVTAVGSSTDDLTPSDVITGAPVVDEPALGQVQALSPEDVATGAPSVDTPALVIVTALSPEDVTTGAPVLDEPALGQVHALTPADLATGAPAIDTASLAQVQALSPDDVATGAPSVDSPSLAQAEVLLPSDLSTGAPVVDEPTLGQAHALSPEDVSTGAPVIDEALLSSEGTDALSPDDLATGAPSLGSPSLGQVHALTVEDVIAGAPVLTSVALTQVQAFAPNPLSTTAPFISSGVLHQVHYLTPEDVYTGAPIIDAAAFIPSAGVPVGLRLAAVARAHEMARKRVTQLRRPT